MTDTTTAWRSVEDARYLPARDEDTFITFARAVPQIDHLKDSSLGTLATMRSYMGDGVQGARTPDPLQPERAQTWCLTHEELTSDCDRRREDGERVDGCVPEMNPRRPDPTAAAAMSPDPALLDYRAHLRDMGTLAQIAQRMIAREAAYPATAQVPSELISVDVGPGDLHCLNCWRAKVLKLIETRKQTPTDTDARTEVPYYNGHCRWCGDMKAAHGFYPPPRLCAKKDQNVRVTAGDWLVATNAHRIEQKAKAKKGKKR